GAPHAPRQQPPQAVLGVVVLVATIARERLVAAVAGQRDRDVSSRETADVPGRHGAGVRERLVERLGEPRLVEHVLDRARVLVQQRATGARRLPRARALVERAALE